MEELPVRRRGYAHPELLAETAWLARRLGDQGIRIIDARPPDQYAAGHIPGAVNLNGFGGIPRAANGDMAPPEEFARLAGSLGVSNDTTVVVYDAPSQTMGMVAWAFIYYGHRAVRMLDGGLGKWLREARALSMDEVRYPAAVFEPTIVDGIYCSLGHAKASAGSTGGVFWDTRSLAEYEGRETAGRAASPRLGHIPGAVHLEWVELLDPVTKTLKTARDMRRLLEAKGITPDVEVSAY